MPAFFVRQPNGLFARFSTIVDHFTHMNLTREVIANGEVEPWLADSVAALQRAEADEPLEEDMPPATDGLGRWRYCLETVLVIHGKKAVAEVEAQVSP